MGLGPHRWGASGLRASAALACRAGRRGSRRRFGEPCGPGALQCICALNLDTAHPEPARPEEYFSRGIHLEHSVTINKSPEELYRYWRDFNNLPRIMDHLESVTVQDEKRSHWVAKAPAGYKVEWDAEIINDEPNKLIAWRSLAEATVPNSGSVRFIAAPGDRGTEIHVVLDYLPPAGRIGWLIARLFGQEPKQQVQEDLRRFKQFMETGEVPTIEGQPAGGGRGQDRVIAGERPLKLQPQPA